MARRYSECERPWRCSITQQGVDRRCDDLWVGVECPDGLRIVALPAHRRAVSVCEVHAPGRRRDDERFTVDHVPADHNPAPVSGPPPVELEQRQRLDETRDRRAKQRTKERVDDAERGPRRWRVDDLARCGDHWRSLWAGLLADGHAVNAFSWTLQPNALTAESRRRW